MSQIVHCGRNCSWRQSGNRTGHCSGCHRTFDGERAFDRHQTVSDGKVTCHDPAAVVYEGARAGEPVYESRIETLDDEGCEVQVTYWRIRMTEDQAERWAGILAQRREEASQSAQRPESVRG